VDFHLAVCGTAWKDIRGRSRRGLTPSFARRALATHENHTRKVTDGCWRPMNHTRKVTDGCWRPMNLYAEGHRWVLATYEPYAEGHKWVLATHEPYAEGHFSDVSSAEGKSSLRTRFLVGSSGSN
jgi:hypothetical protein